MVLTNDTINTSTCAPLVRVDFDLFLRGHFSHNRRRIGIAVAVRVRVGAAVILHHRRLLLLLRREATLATTLACLAQTVAVVLADCKINDIKKHIYDLDEYLIRTVAVPIMSREFLTNFDILCRTERDDTTFAFQFAVIVAIVLRSGSAHAPPEACLDLD